MAEKGFDPQKSKISEATVATFLKNDLQEDILSVPGIGAAAAEKLQGDLGGDSGVETTYQLIGKFLTLKGKGMTVKEHMDAFWHYLAARGVSSHRSGIVNAIAQKVDIMIPGIANYDAEE